MGTKKAKSKKSSGKKTGSGKKKSSHERKTIKGKKSSVQIPLSLAEQIRNLGNGEWKRVGKQEFLAGRLYPRGSLVIIDGATGAKKTWLIMYEAKRLSLGYAIRGGCVPSKHCRVLCIHADLPMEGFKERMLQLGITSKAEPDIDDGMFCLIHRETLDETFSSNSGEGQQFCIDKDFGKEIKNGNLPQGAKYRQSFEDLFDHHRPDMVILDPLFGITSSNFSHGQTATTLIMYLKKLAQKYNACIVVIANQNKKATKGMGAITGGAIFNNAVPIRETIFRLEQEGDELDWSYMDRVKDSFTPPSDEHPAQFRFRVANSKIDGKQRFKTGIFMCEENGEMVEEKKKFKVQKIVYDFDFVLPESGGSGEGRAGDVRKATVKVLTENPDGLIGADCFSKVGEIVTGCSNVTFLKVKNSLIAESVIVAIPTGRKNGKLLRLKKFVK